VQLLVKYGAQVHFEDDFHYTPLHYAAMGPVDYSSSDGSPPDWNETPQYLKIMEILIIAGADPYKSTGKFSQSPIEEAKKVQNPDFVKRALKILQR
jgi:ankyrin repeat protein